MIGTILLTTIALLLLSSMQASSEKYLWQLQQSNVCFGAKNDSFGSLTLKYKGPLLGLKLRHRSGFVNCNANGRSFWGCQNSRYISIAITDEDNKVVLPESLDTKGWVYIPGYDVDSKEVVLDDDGKKMNVYRGMQMRLWYGEDLRNHAEEDNIGRCCVDVFAKLTEEIIHEQNQVWVPQKEYLCLNQGTSSSIGFPLRYSGPLIAVKIVRRFIPGRCSVRRRSRNFPDCVEQSNISIMIGYADDDILFPQVEQWVPLPPSTRKESNHIILKNQNRTEVRRGDMLTILYSGVLTKERICLDVYSMITRERGILMMEIKFTIHINVLDGDRKNIEKQLLLEIIEYFNETLASSMAQWRKLSADYFIFDETINISSILPMRVNMESTPEGTVDVMLSIYDSVSPLKVLLRMHLGFSL